MRDSFQKTTALFLKDNQGSQDEGKGGSGLKEESRKETAADVKAQ